MTRRKRLTIALRKQIAASIRAGGYPHVAARAWGVPLEVFEDWLFRGRSSRAREPYASFAQDMDEAAAQARLWAELDVYQQDKRAWLEHGLGRERQGEPGWARSAGGSDSALAEGNILLSIAGMRLLRRLTDAVADIPEAHQRLTTVIDSERRPGQRRNSSA